MRVGLPLQIEARSGFLTSSAHYLIAMFDDFYSPKVLRCLHIKKSTIYERGDPDAIEPLCLLPHTLLSPCRSNPKRRNGDHPAGDP